MRQHEEKLPHIVIMMTQLNKKLLTFMNETTQMKPCDEGGRERPVSFKILQQGQRSQCQVFFGSAGQLWVDELQFTFLWVQHLNQNSYNIVDNLIKLSFQTVPFECFKPISAENTEWITSRS